ncbi:MAG TPA: xanthine dehydrogenase family protein molybdopterin-binding subunit [Candidatus Limnocylindria bacterium]|nr:xanthine dehydrogenase family protein molybdopterin-binding subunit [Candidatus Limnocylindria bacterium]
MAMNAVNRGDFIRLTGSLGAGLALAFTIPDAAFAAAETTKEFAPNAFVRIAPEGTVTVVVAKSEMGQGVAHGLPTLVAEELDAPLEQVRIEFAPPENRYADLALGMGDVMITGGSTSLPDNWKPLRQAGATARAMLVSAAAKEWGVSPESLRTSAGVVHHPGSGRRATYGSLAAAAAQQPVPQHVALKSPEQYVFIGKKTQRIDIPFKVNGKAEYGIDVRIPGMQYAAIARSPVFGGRVKSFDATKAKAVPGVTHVVQVSNGVAVVAKNTWAAFKGKLALDIAWDEGPLAQVDTPALFAQAEKLAKARTNEKVAVNRGNAQEAKGHVVEAVYRGPLLAHATMEPMNATAHVREDSCEVWAPNQVPMFCRDAAAKITGLPKDKVTVHTTFLGGGFGRRLEWDYVSEAVEVSKAVKLPVKVQWTREDDTQHDFYRTMSVNTVRGVLADGKLVGLEHQVVATPFMRRWFPAGYTKGIDPYVVSDVADVRYHVPNMRVTWVDNENGIPTGSMRAPDANWNDFVTESFIDELAHAAGKDPLAFRLELFPADSREAGVLRLAAEKAGWGKPQPSGIKQGIAFVYWFGSFGAMVADVSMQGNMPKVHRVVAAMDCGIAVNPDIIAQQVQGGTNYGLSHALTSKITIKNGRVQQSNFFDFTVLRMADAPRIEVHIVPSSETPSGIGELGVPPIAPAVGNAIFALTGKRVRSLPFSDALA